MRTTLTVLVLLSSLALGACTSGASSDSGGGAAASETACAMCSRGKAGETVWCDGCNAGYVAGEKIKCQGCYTAKTGGPPCPTCSPK